MHFNTVRSLVVKRLVLEQPRVEIGVEFAIDPCQQIEIKRRRHAGRIVVGHDHLRHGFYKVSPK